MSKSFSPRKRRHEGYEGFGSILSDLRARSLWKAKLNHVLRGEHNLAGVVLTTATEVTTDRNIKSIIF
jgi:hypothetical protein